MKPRQKFTFEGEKYEFIQWGDDGSTEAVNLKTGMVVWLDGVERDENTRKLREQEWRKQKTKRREEKKRSQQRDEERIAAEAYDLFRSIPELSQLADEQLLNKNRKKDT